MKCLGFDLKYFQKTVKKEGVENNEAENWMVIKAG